jgi:hypothetical protein
MTLGTMLLLVLVPLFLLVVLLVGAWRSGPHTVKRTTVYLAYLLSAFVIASCLVYYATLQPVAAGEKSDKQNTASWGYRLQRYRFRDRYKLDIWHYQRFSEMEISHEGPAFWKTPEVIEQRWLAGDRAIYLNLGLGLENSLPQSRTPTRIIYDFDRGEIYLFSPYWLWRRPSEVHGSWERWMTEQQFEEVLQSLQKEN